MTWQLCASARIRCGLRICDVEEDVSCSQAIGKGCCGALEAFCVTRKKPSELLIVFYRRLQCDWLSRIHSIALINLVRDDLIKTDSTSSETGRDSSRSTTGQHAKQGGYDRARKSNQG
jgi:hypothetical protein